MHARLKAPRAAAVDHQTIGGNQQHLKEHKEVEGIAGQEGTDDAHQLKLEQCMEICTARVPFAAHRIEVHRQCKHRGQQHHHRREPVQHQHDPKGGLPVTKLVDLNGAIRRLYRQRRRNCDQQNIGRQREDAL